MRRRANGEGTAPIQRSDGRWQASLWVQEPDGRRIRRTLSAKSQGALRDKVLAMRGRLAVGDPSVDSPVTFSAWAEQWLDQIRTRKSRTYADYRQTLTDHAIPSLGPHPVARITPDMIEGLLRGLERKGLGARTRSKLVTLLRSVLKGAERRGIVRRNAAALVDKPRVKSRAMRPLSPKETAALLEAARGRPLEALFALAIATGMRQGELLGLRWRDVNLDAGFIAIQNTLDQRTMTLDSAKTRTSRRRVELAPGALEALQRHAAACKPRSGAYVFTTASGKPYSASNVQRDAWGPLRLAIKAPEVRFHDLRHTFATLMLAGGAHPKIVSELLGHASVAFTLDTYAHVLPTLASRELDVVRRYLPLPQPQKRTAGQAKRRAKRRARKPARKPDQAAGESRKALTA